MAGEKLNHEHVSDPSQGNSIQDSEMLSAILQQQQAQETRLRQVADELGVSRTTLWRKRILFGINWKPQHRMSIAERLGSDSDDVTAIMEWLAQDPLRSISQLSREIHVSRRTLTSRLSEAYKTNQKTQDNT